MHERKQEAVALLTAWQRAREAERAAIDALLVWIFAAVNGAVGAEPEPEPAPEADGAPDDEPEAPAPAVRTRKYSDARNAVIERDWPLDVPTPEVTRRVNELPGPPCTDQGVACQANTLGVKRPKRYGAALGVAGAAAPDPTLGQAPVVADLPNILRWATERGITVPTTIDAINRRRIALGLPVFVLAAGTHLPPYLRPQP